MGALSSAVTALGTVTGALGAVNSFGGAVRTLAGTGGSSNLKAEQDLAMKSLREKQDAQMRDLQQQASLEGQKIAAESADAEAERRAALRRAVARQKVQFGSQGISAGDGSSQAVLLGLFDESEQDKADRERLDGLRSQALSQNLEAQGQINVLQRSQLAERQKLERISGGF